MRDVTTISGEHKTMLAMETMHAIIVIIVVLAATIIYIVTPSTIPNDLLGFVYGGAITYAGGRASQARGALTRRGDSGSNGDT